MAKPSPSATWDRPWWTRATVFAVAWAALVVYGSLIPFHFDGPSFVRQAGGLRPALVAWITSPHWHVGSSRLSSLGVEAWVSDLALNLALYVPLGLLVRLALHKPGRRAHVEVGLASMIVIGLSWMLECTQSLSPTRYASINDFLANVIPGLLAVIVAPHVTHLLRQIVFRLYTALANPLYHAKDWLVSARQKPTMMFIVVTANLILIVSIYVLMGQPITRVAGDHINLLPFDQHFRRSYDVAAWLVARTLIVYCLLGAMASLMLVKLKARRSLAGVVLVMALLAMGVEAVRYQTNNTRPDITEPILAIAATGLLFITLYLLVHAVRCSCRRHTQDDFAGHDRRKRTHLYPSHTA